MWYEPRNHLGLEFMVYNSNSSMLQLPTIYHLNLKFSLSLLYFWANKDSSTMIKMAIFSHHAFVLGWIADFSDSMIVGFNISWANISQCFLRTMAKAWPPVGEEWQARQTSQALGAQGATSTIYSNTYGMWGRNHLWNRVHSCQPSPP